jgi:hypothetical protein
MDSGTASAWFQAGGPGHSFQFGDLLMGYNHKGTDLPLRGRAWRFYLYQFDSLITPKQSLDDRIIIYNEAGIALIISENIDHLDLFFSLLCCHYS